MDIHMKGYLVNLRPFCTKEVTFVTSIYITKTRLFKYIEYLQPKTETFQIKKWYFFIFLLKT